jgi:hypothetical protein
MGQRSMVSVSDSLDERFYSTEAAALIRQLEQLLETRIVSIVTSSRGLQLAFWLPGEAGETYTRWALRAIGSAARDALKSR